MNVSSKRNWTAEELSDLQRRGQFFFEMLPRARASEELRPQNEARRTTENAAESQSPQASTPGSAAGHS